MRRVAATIAALTLVLGLASVMPAHADCETPSCPVGISILEGIGYVCGVATVPGEDPQPCTYHTDEFYDDPAPPLGDGLYFPTFGPPAVGPFSFVAGPQQQPPESICVSSQGGQGCKFDSWGWLTPGDSGYGAYCGSSLGEGKSIFTAADGTVLHAEFGWSQSAATILPLIGEVTASSAPDDSNPAYNNGAKGANVLGFTSSRGTSDGGNCGIRQVTTAFNVEGMVMTY